MALFNIVFFLFDGRPEKGETEKIVQNLPAFYSVCFEERCATRHRTAARETIPNEKRRILREVP